MSHPLDPPAIRKLEILERQARARNAAGAAGYDALLVIGRSFYDRPGDLAYLSNHLPPFPTTVFSETNQGMGHAFFLLPVEGDTVLVTDPRRWREDLIVADDARSASDLIGATIALIKEKKLDTARRGLVGDDILPAPFDRRLHAELPDASIVPESTIVARMRAIKSSTEQALMRRAAACADSAIVAARDAIRRGGATERDVCADAFSAALRDGADFLRYFRVHSGPWSAAGSRWPQAMDRRIEEGDIVVVDAIGAFQGYHFDVNRTIAAGSLGPREHALCETVLDATTVAVAACQAGAVVGDIARAAREVILASPFADGLGAMMGHGIGMETVELPYVMVAEESILEAGMSLCIEPGLFFPGWAGCSIEQEVIVQPVGPPEIITADTPMRMW